MSDMCVTANAARQPMETEIESLYSIRQPGRCPSRVIISILFSAEYLILKLKCLMMRLGRSRVSTGSLKSSFLIIFLISRMIQLVNRSYNYIILSWVSDTEVKVPDDETLLFASVYRKPKELLLNNFSNLQNDLTGDQKL